MPKSLFELINDKQAIAELAAKQAGVKPQPNTTTQQSSLLGAANTFVQNTIGVNAKELLVKYVGQTPIDRLRVEANFIQKFPAIALKVYGLDAPRILLQRDPHANKKIIERGTGAVASVIGVIPFIGKTLKSKINNTIKDGLKPLYPDDWLNDPDGANPTFKGRYEEIYKHTLSNGRGLIGNYLQGTRTVSQAKDNLLASGLSLGVGAALDLVQGVAKTFGGRTTKEGKTLGPGFNNNREKTTEYPIWVPHFPSEYAISSKTLDDDDVVMEFGFQQLRGKDFLDVGKKMYNKTTKSNMAKPDVTLDNLYDTRYNYNNRNKKVAPNTKAFNLANQGTIDKTTKKTGIYSKDVLIAQTGKALRQTNSITEFNEKNKFNTGSLHLDYFTTNLSVNGGDGTINDYGKWAESTSTLRNGSYYASYTPINSAYLPGPADVKPVRWNTITAPYSEAYIIKGQPDSGNNILDQDYYFAENSKQSQNKVNKNINPYYHKKLEILNTAPDKENDKYDRVKFKLGTVNLLGTLTGITDTTTPSWSDVKPVGSGFKFYIYDSWEREISFKIRCYAESQNELNSIWRRATQIKSYTLPTAKGILGVFGKTIPLQIGNLITIPFGFLTQCNVTILDESPWEITEGLQKPFIFDMDISYKVIDNNDNHTHYQPQTPFIAAYPYKSTRGEDLNPPPPPPGGFDFVPHTKTTIPPSIDLINPLLGGDPALINRTPPPPGTGVTGTPVITETPTQKPPNGTFTELDKTGSPEARTDALKMQEEVKNKFTKGAGYGGGGYPIFENTYVGDKPKWWQFRERRKYNRSFTVHMSGQTN